MVDDNGNKNDNSLLIDVPADKNKPIVVPISKKKPDYDDKTDKTTVSDETDDETSGGGSPKNTGPVKQSAFAWKESGADFNEMSSRRINRKKAEENAAKSKTSLNSNDGKKAAPKELALAGLQKVNTKIKQNAYDDDEDENGFIYVGTLNDNSLADALTLEENKELASRKEMQNNKNLQNAGKLEAAIAAEKMANQAGVSLGANTVDKNIASATYTMDQMGKHLNKDLAKELKIAKPGRIPASQHKDLVQGVKKIKEKGGKVSNMKVDDVAKAAKADDKEVAKMIYKTADREDKKKIHRQTDIELIIQKTGIKDNKMTRSEKEKNAIKQIEKGNVRIESQKTREQKGR